jgi:hypothetical protein
MLTITTYSANIVLVRVLLVKRIVMAVARQPNMLKGGFGPLGNAEPVHGDDR